MSSTRGKRKLAGSPDERGDEKRPRETHRCVLWASSLTRAGYTKVEFDSLDFLQNIAVENEIHVGRRLQLPCQLFPTSKFRNGRERSWCPVHQGAYGKIAQVEEAQSSGVPKCDQFLDPIDIVLESDIPIFDVNNHSQFSVSIGLPPFSPESNVVNIHIEAGTIDKSYPAVYLKNLPNCLFSCSGKGLLVTPPAALEAFMQMEAAQVGKEDQPGPRLPVKLTDVVQCKHCKNLHEDVGDFFGQNYHKKHLCGHCGREIFGKPNIGNPLGVFVKGTKPMMEQAKEVLEIDSATQKFKVWPTVPAFFSKSLEPALHGVRVVFDADEMNCRIDKIYRSVVVDGETINRQKALQAVLDRIRAKTVSETK